MEVSEVETAKLAAMGAPYNPRRISDHDLAALRRSMKFFGTVQPIIVNKRSGHIVGGHMRVQAAQAEGMETLPVVEVDLDEPSERQLNLALNKISGGWDEDKLAQALGEIDAAGAELALTGFEPFEIDKYLKSLAGADGTQEEPVPEPPANPVSQPGDLYLLGDHRLVCGDSTQEATAATAMGDLEPFIMVTDPPYGVEYNPEWRAEAGINQNRGRMGTVQGDDRADWSSAYMLFPGDVSYTWHAGRHASEVQTSIEASGFEIRCQLIWKKSRFVLSRGAYHWGHEPCWYAVRSGKKARWCGDRSQSTIWDIALAGSAGDDAKGLGHGTQKPIECMARPMRNHGNRGDVVYDPFLGSGTTLIAAEQESRKCVGVEIDPGYADVIVERWEAFTGKKAERKRAS